MEKDLASIIQEQNLETVKDTLGVLDGTNGTVNHKGLWKLKKKVDPKVKTSLPIGKKNAEGRIVTNPDELK